MFTQFTPVGVLDHSNTSGVYWYITGVYWYCTLICYKHHITSPKSIYIYYRVSIVQKCNGEKKMILIYCSSLKSARAHPHTQPPTKYFVFVLHTILMHNICKETVLKDVAGFNQYVVCVCVCAIEDNRKTEYMTHPQREDCTIVTQTVCGLHDDVSEAHSQLLILTLVLMCCYDYTEEAQYG